MTDLAAIQRVTDVDPESILVNALNTWFGSVLACETFHADMCALQPHPSHMSFCSFVADELAATPSSPHLRVFKMCKACWSPG